jgi:hypothetical protein
MDEKQGDQADLGDGQQRVAFERLGVMVERLVADEEEGPRPQGARTVRLRMILCETCGEVFSALGIANHRIACERDAAVAS